mmetsp:Transcript_5412/g.15487  ORF Transcript_5412/g.15487 Transcript_5412/m.15487 type:complete len:223 (-) Transcript_5412:290-958(-)
MQRVAHLVHSASVLGLARKLRQCSPLKRQSSCFTNGCLPTEILSVTTGDHDVRVGWAVLESREHARAELCGARYKHAVAREGCGGEQAADHADTRLEHVHVTHFAEIQCFGVCNPGTCHCEFLIHSHQVQSVQAVNKCQTQVPPVVTPLRHWLELVATPTIFHVAFIPSMVHHREDLFLEGSPCTACENRFGALRVTRRKECWCRPHRFCHQRQQFCHNWPC